MTPQEINTAIVEWMGWKLNPNQDSFQNIPWGCSAAFPNYEFAHQLPNYYSDLNAVQSAVLALPKDLWMKYGYALWSVIFLDHKGELETGNYDPWNWLNATAPQRCEALLRMIGKWKD